MKKEILTIVDFDKNNAAPKAKADVAAFLKPLSFTSTLIHTDFHSKFQKLRLTYWELPHYLRTHRNMDELIFQYPAYSFFVMDRFLKDFHHHCHAKLIFFVHDIEALRMFSSQEEGIHEMNVLNQADGLIVHNQKMAHYLKSQGVKKPMVSLDIFDYLNPQPLIQRKHYEQTVCYAGNLMKSGFLTKIDDAHLKLNVFGPNPADHYQNGVEYCGQYSPEQLPEHLQYDFGLVWDGDQLDTCSGKYGHYLKYNAPHKASLYLSSGIPVIIWKQAALAKFIEQHNLGIVISNLNDLSQTLQSLDKTRYMEIKSNVMKFAENLNNGYFTRRAVNKMEELLKFN
ncbi:galactofuranosyltransferase [Limosilactobacillus sp.]|uniref:galactofuranosyltransferase n=1 Tax=Limosilactobacillus sp. TaxID=2773925 RepID=UPI00345E1BDA